MNTKFGLLAFWVLLIELCYLYVQESIAEQIEQIMELENLEEACFHYLKMHFHCMCKEPESTIGIIFHFGFFIILSFHAEMETPS